MLFFALVALLALSTSAQDYDGEDESAGGAGEGSFGGGDFGADSAEGFEAGGSGSFEPGFAASSNKLVKILKSAPQKH